jgi:hypothetical protein
MNEKVDPDIPGQSYDYGQKYDHCNNNGNKSIDQGSSYEQIRDYKSSNGKGYAHGITHIHGSIKKGRFDLVFCIASRTTLVHFE